MALQNLDPVPVVQGRKGMAARRPLTAPGYHPALLSKGNRGVGNAPEPRAADITVMLAGWFGFGFLLGLPFL